MILGPVTKVAGSIPVSWSSAKWFGLVPHLSYSNSVNCNLFLSQDNISRTIPSVCDHVTSVITENMIS